MHIPIENIYYLLCYAWNKLEEKERVNVSIDDKTALIDLFVKILINATRTLLKKGVDKNYIEFTEELPGLKGKLQVSETLKSYTLFNQRTICSFDEFSSDILPNQILKSTLFKLIRVENLDNSLKKEVVTLQRMFPPINLIEITPSSFARLKIHRNNQYYGFIMNVCQIIFDNTLPSEEKGKYKFIDFRRDEAKMNRLFEQFIKNFYKREQKIYSVKGEIIKWKFNEESVNSIQYLPRMETDITLENNFDKIIIDAKYYRETLTSNYGNKKIHSSNLYQLFSYLINQEDGSSKNKKATGILIYPTTQDEYNLDYNYHDHKIKIRTLNLNTDWKNISKRLDDIIT